MISFTRSKSEAATIRRIFQGEPEAYRLIIEQYQPMVYAIALAQTGNVFLADKAVASTFEEGYGRLVSLTDARKLGVLLSSLAQHISEQLSLRRTPNWNKPRPRTGTPPVDLKWVQTELIEPLGEELGSFTLQERRGILLHAFCGFSSRQIAEVLKIERKDAAEDLARTRENVEAALLKEVVKALDLEVNSKERLLHILRNVAGAAVASKAEDQTRIGRKKTKLMPAILASVIVLVLGITAYFGYRVVNRIRTGWDAPAPVAARDTSSDAADEAASPDDTPAVLPGNYTIQGRVVDERFITDGVAGVIVEAGGKQAETDFYGSFEIRGVARGQHDVSIRSGHHTIKRGVRMHTEEHNEPIMIPVDENIATPFRFRGRVFDRNTGQAIPRFEVATCKDFVEMIQPYLIKQFREQRHLEGVLEDRFITLGDYTMFVRAQGYAPLPVYFTIDESWTGQRVFEFPLYRSTGLIGAVYGANELSVGGASIIPRQGTAYGVILESLEFARTNSMGRFELYTLSVGVQSFMVTHLQHGVARAIVELEPGKTSEIRVQFPRRGALTGDITLDRRPTRFREFRRRIGGSTIDLTKNVNYISSGQYEIVLTPEPITLVAGVGPGASDRWFERRMEQDTTVSMTEPTWLDFNFVGGRGSIQGNISVQGTAPRVVFAEVVYVLEKGRDILVFDLGSAGGFKLDNLPPGRGEVTIYTSVRPTDRGDFHAARVLMDKQTRPFSLDESQGYVYLDFSL